MALIIVAFLATNVAIRATLGVYIGFTTGFDTIAMASDAQEKGCVYQRRDGWSETLYYWGD